MKKISSIRDFSAEIKSLLYELKNSFSLDFLVGFQEIKNFSIITGKKMLYLNNLKDNILKKQPAIRNITATFPFKKEVIGYVTDDHSTVKLLSRYSRKQAITLSLLLYNFNVYSEPKN